MILIIILSLIIIIFFFILIVSIMEMRCKYRCIASGYRIIEDRTDQRIRFVPEFRNGCGEWNPFDFQCDFGGKLALEPVRDPYVKFYQKDFDKYEDAEKFLKKVNGKFAVFPTIWQDLIHRPMFALGLDMHNPDTAQPGQTVLIQMTSDNGFN